MEKISIEKIMDNYMKKIASETNLDNIKNIVAEMFDNDNLSDIDMEWIYNHCLIPKLKEYFNIDIPYLAEQNDMGTYEYIIRNFGK